MSNVRHIRPVRTPEQRQADKGAEMSDAQVICGSLHRHQFPSDEWLGKNSRQPRGTDVELQPDGCYLITDVCARGCGKIRHLVTAPRQAGTVERRWYDQDPETPWVTVREDDELGGYSEVYKTAKAYRQADLIAAVAAARRAAPAAKFAEGAAP